VTSDVPAAFCGTTFTLVLVPTLLALPVPGAALDV
jgi:hypothetical protein